MMFNSLGILFGNRRIKPKPKKKADDDLVSLATGRSKHHPRLGEKH